MGGLSHHVCVCNEHCLSAHFPCEIIFDRFLISDNSKKDKPAQITTVILEKIIKNLGQIS